MKKLFVLFLLLTASLHAATTFTEFYCQTTGSNLNAGSSTADAALVTATNGNWDSTTGVFICAGATDLSAVTVGMFASIYTDGATVGVFVARITAVVDSTDTITVSLTAKSGTAPSTSATARTARVGGAWKGPNGTEDFPFNFVAATMTDSAGNYPRVNLLAQTYSVTDGVTHSVVGPIRWQGYTATPGDLGKAIIDGGSPSASFNLFTASGANNDYADLIFANNGTASGTGQGINISSAECNFNRVVVHNIYRDGFNIGVSCTLTECEAYLCNTSNTAAHGGFATTASGVLFVRDFAHDNAGSNNDGFYMANASNPCTMFYCLSDTNGRNGVTVTSTAGFNFFSSDFYNNGAAGIDLTGASAASFAFQNCNFLKNTTFGVTSSGSPIRNGSMMNCGFGTGTQANASGDLATNLGAINVTGSISYASNVTPWVDPANGDFRINLPSAKGTGRGTFTQTQASYTGTISYPDIGAAQHLESASTGGGSYTFAQ